MKLDMDLSKLTEKEREELRKEVQKMAQQFFSDADFEKEIKTEVKYIIERANENKDKSIMPHMLVFGFKKSEEEKRPMIYIAFADMPEPEKRREAFRAIGAKFAFENESFMPFCVIFTTEAWTRQSSKEEEKARDKDKMISEYEDKKECIIVSGITIDQRERTTQIMITRDKDNNIVPEDKPIEMKDSNNYLLRNFIYGYSIGMRMKDK